MILDFSVSNWMSFRDNTHLSMIATELDDHSERIQFLENYKTRVLPISMIFGGNASGKSNLVKAMAFAREFVLRGRNIDEEIGVTPFRLSPEFSDRETSFDFRMLCENTIYEYGFSVNENRVTKEELTAVIEDNDVLFFRRKDDEIEISEKLKNDNNIEDRDLLRFLERSTRNNNLFLTSSISQNFDLFRPIFNWFRSLMILVPSSTFQEFHYFFNEQNPYTVVLNKVIQKLDVGISSIQSEEVLIENALPNDVITRIKRNLREGIATFEDALGNRILVARNNGELSAKKLMANHKSSDGKDVKFEFREESDGTRRIIELLPAFFDVITRNGVLIVDEIDSSLHSVLIHGLLEAFLDKCEPNNMSQVILTTHNVDVMDKNLIRPDEIWITERMQDGSTNLKTLSEFKVSRTEADFRKFYLEGKFGGIPHFQIDDVLDFQE